MAGQKNHTGNTDPYIVIQTHADKAETAEAKPIDYENYPGYKKSFFLSLYDKLPPHQKDERPFYAAGRKYFATYLNGELKKQLQKQGYKEPQWYINFLAYIFNKANTNHLPTPVDEVLKYYKDERPSNEQKEALKRTLTLLHRHGMVLYYNTPQLQSHVWLNPQELVKHIQQNVLKKEMITLSQRNVVEKKDFEMLFKKDHKILLLLLEQKVVFLHKPSDKPEDDEYIIPNFLPMAKDTDPDFYLFGMGLAQPDFVIKFNDFLPFGFINQLICFFGKQPDVKKFWRNQLLFTLNKEVRVLIQLDFAVLTIKIFIEKLSGKTPDLKKVQNYLFYAILALYWDRWEPLGYEEINTVGNKSQNNQENESKESAANSSEGELIKQQKKDKTHDEIVLEGAAKYRAENWQQLQRNAEYIPADAYLSVDNERYIYYKDLFNLNEGYTINSYLVSNGRIDITKGKAIAAAPFAPFTFKKIPGMKKVFISYSHDDINYRQTLQQYLVNVERDNLIEIWQDGLIQAGDDWDKKIRHSLETADICIMLLSQAFIASNYIHEVEFEAIMKKRKSENCKIIPVLIRDCDWKNWKVSPSDVKDSVTNEKPEYAIGSYQFLPIENKRLKPVVKFEHPEEAWLQVVETVRSFCKA